MTKKKILCWCDFIAPTGFGNVAKNLLDELHLYYDVSIVGINYQGDIKYDTSKYFVYPITREDLLGVKRLYDIAKRDQPDLIFLFQDIFHISDIIEKLKKVSPKSKIVIYFPVDGYPFSAAWQNALELSDAVITYTDWAIKVIKEKFPQFNKPIHKLYHGIDTSVFYPQPIELIEENRKKANWNQKFVIINVNRFQPRKAIPLSVRAFSMFAKGYKRCKCGHAMPLANTYCEVNMCPPEDIVFTQDDKKDDVYYYLHMSAMEYSMGQNRTCLLQNHLINAGFTNEDYSKIIGINAKKIYANEVPEAELNNLYNASNLNITSSGGEGAGLSLLESAATGTPSLAPKNSAIPEMLNGTGTLVSNNAAYSHPMDNAHIRPIVNVEEMMLRLEDYYNMWKALGKEKTIDQACINNINANFLWPDKREILHKIFKEILEKNE